MSEKDNEGRHRYHIRLNSYDRKCLEYMKARHGISWAAAMRVCVRAAAWQMGFPKPSELDRE